MTLRKTITGLAEQFAENVLQALRRSSFEDLAALTTHTANNNPAPTRRRRRRRRTAKPVETPAFETAVAALPSARAHKTAAKKTAAKTKTTAAKKPGRPTKTIARPAGFETLGFKKQKKQAKTRTRAKKSPTTVITDFNPALHDPRYAANEAKKAVTEEGSFSP